MRHIAQHCATEACRAGCGFASTWELETSAASLGLACYGSHGESKPEWPEGGHFINCRSPKCWRERPLITPTREDAQAGSNEQAK